MHRRSNFDLTALYDALDTQRRARGLSWAAVTREVNARFENVPGHKPIATSTITSLSKKVIAEGDCVLQLLLWLDRTPESFVVPPLVSAGVKLRELDKTQILRWDTRAIHAALEVERRARGMTWRDVADEIGGFPADGLSSLSRGGRTSLPAVMRIFAWLGRPAATFTRASDW